MKLLVIGNGVVGNVKGEFFINKHTANFCEELNAAGAKVGFLEFEKAIQLDENLLDCSLSNNIQCYSISLDKFRGKIGKILSYFLMTFLLIKTIMKYDFIYIFYPGHIPVIGSLISIILRKKYALYIRGQHNLNTKVGSFIIEKAEFCLTVSELLKETVLRNNQQTDVIAPMIDFSKNDILLSREYSNDGVFRCLFVGRIEVRKGVYNLIDAIKILKQKKPFLHFDIVGGGDSLDDIKEKTKDFTNITLHGQISEKEQLLMIYRTADLFIFPSHDEGFPRVLYEAMMSRVPIVTTMVGGIGGLMKDNYNCLAMESNNSDAIVRTVSKIVESLDLRQTLVNHATKDILKLFDGNRKKHSVLVMNKIGFKYGAR